MDFYKRIRDLREDNELKQSDIAEIIKTTQSYYAQYENGKRQIPFDRAVEIAEFYRVSLDYLAGRTNDKRGLTKSDMSQEEIDIIKKYRSLNEKRQGVLLGTLNTLVGDQEEETTKDREVI